jgi:outer membrane protein assembly factor BamB
LHGRQLFRPAFLPLPFRKKKIFLTAIDEGRLVTLAIDKATGKIVWKRKAPEVPIEKCHKASSPASSTPYVDEDRLFVYFGSYGLLCNDHEGKELWKKPIPTPKSLYGMSTSPVVYKDKVILVLDNDANAPKSKLSHSPILALNKNTGKTAGETPRPFQRSGWSTPMIQKHEDGAELVILGNGRLWDSIHKSIVNDRVREEVNLPE